MLPSVFPGMGSGRRGWRERETEGGGRGRGREEWGGGRKALSLMFCMVSEACAVGVRGNNKGASHVVGRKGGGKVLAVSMC